MPVRDVMSETPSVRVAARPKAMRVRTWNRRLHYYLGLYLLFFIWLFSISGLLLNNQWELTRAERQQTSSTREITRPAATGDVAIVRDLMQQLGIAGEVDRIERSPADDTFSFQVSRPGRNVTVEAHLAHGTAVVDERDANLWAVLHQLHMFTGVSMDEPDRQREWFLTRIWSFAMDAVALGLVILLLSGLYLWYRIPKKRRSGLVFLGMGTATCGFFLYGLPWIT